MKRLRYHIHSFWKACLNEKDKDFFLLFVFSLLYLCEPIYRSIFYISQVIKKCFIRRVGNLKVISVGNIVAGGTGKSLFARFLIHSFAQKRGAILLRGYGGNNEKKRQSIMVSDGKKALSDVYASGDEAYMLAQECQVPVIVGKNRARSARLLQKWSQDHEQRDYVVLDDAYQHHSLKKDIEILLLDARKPFDNGYCLPAGLLREHDITRADCIIFTHGDAINPEQLLETKNIVEEEVGHPHVFTGKHVVQRFMQGGDRHFAQDSFIRKRVVAVAGIGSFAGFLRSIESCGLKVEESCEYEDHHIYTSSEVDEFICRAQHPCIDGIVTTRKDWHKIEALLAPYQFAYHHIFFVLDIEFAFMDEEEHKRFRHFLCDKLAWEPS